MKTIDSFTPEITRRLRLRLLFLNPLHQIDLIILMLLVGAVVTSYALRNEPPTFGHMAGDFLIIMLLVALTLLLYWVDLVASISGYQKTWQAYAEHAARAYARDTQIRFRSRQWMAQFSRLQPCPRTGARTAIRDFERELLSS